ncbi:hypothetical protein BH09SUM1_BH09SUM1_29510 [soil metagenome]
MLGRLERWLWKGTLEPNTARLEPLLHAETEVDLVHLFSATIKQISHQLDMAKQAADRRRAAEMAGGSQLSSGEPDVETRQIARAMLPSLDALDRIVEFGEPLASRDEAFQNWLTSIKGLRTRLTKTLETIGLTAMAAVGSEVDLEIHDVVSVVAAGNFPANSVVAEQQRGYYFKGKLLRDAKVVIAQ